MKLTAVVTWNDDPRTGCVAMCPELDVRVSAMDPDQAREALKVEVLAWMCKQKDAIPLKSMVSEFAVAIPPESEK